MYYYFQADCLLFIVSLPTLLFNFFLLIMSFKE